MPRVLALVLILLGSTTALLHAPRTHALGATAVALPSCDSIPGSCTAAPFVEIDDLVLTTATPTASLTILFEPGFSWLLLDSDTDEDRVTFGYRIVNQSADSATFRHGFAFLDRDGVPIPGAVFPSFAVGTFDPGEQALAILETIDLSSLLPLEIFGVRMRVELESGPGTLTIDALRSFSVSRLDAASRVIPEPTASTLILIGLAGLSFSRRRPRA